MAKRFHFLSGDINYLDYGGKWYRKVDSTRFHIIKLINMWDATGETNQDKYNVSEVDITSPQLKEACECADCGDSELEKAESLHSYGAAAPLGNWSGSNSRELLTQAKRESRELDNPKAYEAAMSRPVNLLGSTAREYANGDIDSAINRYKESKIQFGTLTTEGTVINVREIKHSSICKCPFFILVPDHYRSDGSCKCNDRAERDKMIAEWEYKEEDFANIPLAT